MKAKFARLRLNFMFFIVGIGVVVGSQVQAQSTTLEYGKATLVSKFAKYIDWPAEAIQSNFVIGVYKDVDKYEYFKNFFANKGVKGKDILVLSVKSLEEAKKVNILYLSSNKKKLLTSMSKTISGSHVLMITENSKDMSKTMIDVSYNQKKSSLFFKVNDPNIANEQLVIPELSYFLGDNKEEILSVSPTFALQMQKNKELLALQNKITQQKISLNKLNKKLSVSEDNSEKSNLDLLKATVSLKVSQKENAKQNKKIKSKDKELQELKKQLQVQQAQLKMNKQDWQVSNEDKVIEQDKFIEQEKEVTELTEKLKKQKGVTNNTAIKLANMTKENKALSSFKVLFYVFVIIAAIALLIAFIMWKKTKSAALQTLLPTKNENTKLLSIREEQLIKSENFTALGYIATDITYAVGLSLADLQAQLESAEDTKNVETLKPVVTLLENFNLIAADQDDTDIQNFDVIDYMQKMMMLYEFEFSQSNIVYHYSGEKALKIKSVPSYIALMLLNLINNSLKHGFDNEGNGKIALKIEKRAKSGVKITFSDDGKGMSKAILEQVFTQFFTTHSDRGYVGVGMSTTYDLIKKKLAGDIKIESKEGKGTTVTITLP